MSVTLKNPCWTDEYDRQVAEHADFALFPATALWVRRLGGPEETRPTEITYLRGLSFGDNKPRRCITVAVTGIEFKPHAPNGGLGVFTVKHAPLDKNNETKETP